jgi:diacylglycerol O-acyltransferase
MDRLSPLDSFFLHVEDDVNHMHIGSVGIFEGPPPPYEDLTRTVAGRLSLVPRYRQKVAPVPLSLGRPVWVDDPHFNIEYHVRHTALPRPGGEAELRRLVGRVMSQQLDRAKPLWELWMVEGLGEDRWAIVSKVHHCLVDGVSGSELMTVIFDLTQDVPPPDDDDGWQPHAPPSSLQLALEAAVDLVTSPYEQVRAATSALVRRPQRTLDAVREVAKGSVALSGLVRPTAPTSLNGPIGPHRHYTWTRSSPGGSGNCCWPGARRSTTGRSAPSCRCPCAPAARRARPRATARWRTGCRRCSPSCRSASTTRSSACTPSAPSSTTSRSPARRSPARR